MTTITDGTSEARAVATRLVEMAKGWKDTTRGNPHFPLDVSITDLLALEPLLSPPTPARHTPQDALLEALHDAAQRFEAIKAALEKRPDEAERKAFWNAIAGKGAIRTALALLTSSNTPDSHRS